MVPWWQKFWTKWDLQHANRTDSCQAGLKMSFWDKHIQSFDYVLHCCRASLIKRSALTVSILPIFLWIFQATFLKYVCNMYLSKCIKKIYFLSYSFAPLKSITAQNNVKIRQYIIHKLNTQMQCKINVWVVDFYITHVY